MGIETTTFFEKTKSTAISDVDFLFYLNLSVLAGEYIFDEDKLFKKDKSERLNTTKNEVKSADDDSENNTEESKPSSAPKSSLNRESLLGKYSDFSVKINENLNYLCEGISYSQIDVDILRSSSLHRILDGDIFNEPKDKSIEYDEIQNLRNLFFLNLFIADYDENLESDKLCEKELKEIEKFLKNFQESNKALEISKILLDKTRYLLFKIRYRSKPFRKLKYHDDVGLLTTDAVSLNQKHDLYISKDNVFFEFVKKTIDHYEKEKEDVQLSKKEFSNHFNLIRDEFDKKEIKKHSISFFFEYNRYLKKAETNYDEKIKVLESIIAEIERRIIDVHNSGNKFEMLSYKSCKNLLSNTKFRLFLAELQKSIEEGTILFNDSFYKESESTIVINFFNKITAERKKIPPYFDYKQFEVQMDFFDRLIETLMDQEMILEKFSFLSGENTNKESNVLEYDQYLKNIYAKIAVIKDIYLEFLDRFNCWDLESKDLGLLPIYLGKEDCMIPYKLKTSEEETKIKLFLDSSYVLPVDYSRIDEKKTEEKLQLDSKIQVIKSKIEALYNYKKSKIAAEDITKQIDTFKEDKETMSIDLEKKIKDGEFKTIQIVALFVTIASFVLMQVKIYDNKSGVESIAITFSLAGILVLFNGIIHWMIEGRKEAIKVTDVKEKEEKVEEKEKGTENILCKQLSSLVTTPVIFVSLLLLGLSLILFTITKLSGWDMDSEKNKMLEEKVTVFKETEKMKMGRKEDSMQMEELKRKAEKMGIERNEDLMQIKEIKKEVDSLKKRIK